MVEVLSREEIKLIEESATNERDKLIVRILADSGMRVGELVSLRTADLTEIEYRCFVVVRGKTGERLVPIERSLQRRIRSYIERQRPKEVDSDRLLVSLRQRPGGGYQVLTESGVQQLVRDLGDRAALSKRVHPHIFRHSCATWMLRQGMNPLLVMQVLGHTNLRMITDVYSHLSMSDAHAALMRLLSDDR